VGNKRSELHALTSIEQKEARKIQDINPMPFLQNYRKIIHREIEE